MISKQVSTSLSCFTPCFAPFYPLDREVGTFIQLQWLLPESLNVILLLCHALFDSFIAWLFFVRDVVWQQEQYIGIYTQSCLWNNGVDKLFSGDFFPSLRTEWYCFISLLPVTHHSCSNRWLRHHIRLGSSTRNCRTFMDEC